MTTTPIHTLQDFLADEAQFPAAKGHRDPASPGFIYFDDDRELHPDIKAFREDMANIEEAKAFKEHENALDKRLEEKVRKRKVRIDPYIEDTGRKTDENPSLPRAPLPVPTAKDIKRGEMFAAAFTRRVTPEPAFIDEIEDDFEMLSDEEAIYELCEYVNLTQVLNDRYNKEYPEYDDNGVCINPFQDLKLIKKESKPMTYSAIREEQRFCNWLVDFHKKQPRNNDRWRKLVGPLSNHLDEHNPLAPIARCILRTLREALPMAPGPAKCTVFKNPDGSRYESPSINFGAAKASFIKRHKLTEEFVSVDRVQYEGERHSRYVVGIRRTSDQTPSNYYDPNPTWGEKRRDGEWTKAYQPTACNLYRMPASKVLEPGAYRLTVREFEQAIIAGAETYDSEIDSFVHEFEGDFLPDSRVMLLNMGDGCDGRDPSSLTHEEAYLYSVLQMFGEDQACQLMLIENQEPGLLRNHFLRSEDLAKKSKPKGKGKEITATPMSPTVVNILRFVGTDPEAREENLLKFVINALTALPPEEVERRTDMKSRSRDNKRVLSKDFAPHDYGFEKLIRQEPSAWELNLDLDCNLFACEGFEADDAE